MWWKFIPRTSVFCKKKNFHKSNFLMWVNLAFVEAVTIKYVNSKGRKSALVSKSTKDRLTAVLGSNDSGILI
jgi:hypothetical protein